MNSTHRMMVAVTVVILVIPMMQVVMFPLIAAAVFVGIKLISLISRFVLARIFWSKNKNKFSSKADYDADQRAWEILKNHLSWWQRFTLWGTASFTTWHGVLRLRQNMFHTSVANIVFIGPIPVLNVCVLADRPAVKDRWGYLKFYGDRVPRGDDALTVLLAWKGNYSYFWERAISGPPLPGMGVTGGF